MQVKEFFFVASNEHAAEVIGSNGWKVKSIAKKTETQIKCPSPIDTPVFCISGRKHNVDLAKKLIQSWANHFDRTRTLKRNIWMEPGNSIQTAVFKNIDVACIIGKKGKQIKKISTVAGVKIVSPDINKAPIFIVSGKHENLEKAVFWMKLTAFCASGANYFTSHDTTRIEHILANLQHNYESDFMKSTRKIVNLKKFREKFNSSVIFDISELEDATSLNTYNCCYCKQKKFKIARSVTCGHVISCDLCIAKLYRDIYLQCYFCKVYVENFLIEKYSF